MSDKLPTPVHIVAPASMPVTAAEPLPVVIHEGEDKPAPIPSVDKMTMPPTTTAQEDLVTSRQSRINLLWEVNQALIAQIVVVGTIGAGVHGHIAGNSKEVPVWLGVAFGTVIGFYFGRTNHERTGGIGAKTGQRR